MTEMIKTEKSQDRKHRTPQTLRSLLKTTGLYIFTTAEKLINLQHRCTINFNVLFDFGH